MSNKRSENLVNGWDTLMFTKSVVGVKIKKRTESKKDIKLNCIFVLTCTCHSTQFYHNTNYMLIVRFFF